MPRDPKGQPPPEEEELEEAPESPLRYGWFGTLLIASWRLWKRHWKSVTPPFIVLMTVLALVDLAITQTRAANPTEAVGALTSLLQILGVPLFGAWVAARAAVMIDERDSGAAKEILAENATFRSAGERTKPQRSHIAAAAMLAGALTFLMVLALGRLGLLIALNFFLGPPILIHAVAVEGLSFADAWVRLKELIKGEAGRVVVYLVAIALGVGLLQVVIVGSLFVGMTEVALGSAVEIVASVVIYVLVEGLALAFMACVGMAAYRELRERKEAPAA